MAPRAGRISPDTLAGRYEIEGPLGSGGMGIVVRGRDQLLDRTVAIKLLADNLAMDDDARARFDREARAAARLNHPNVVQVFDVGEEDGRPYLVMELVEGPTLADRLLDQPPQGDELVEIARQALDALEHSHDSGLLHRDIKPGNLMISPDGVLKVTDFGVAEVAEVEGITRTGHVLGTMPYLAPERLRGEPASAASDLYALGATLHEVATGAPPRDERPLPGDLPQRLRTLIQGCLADDPRERPGSAAEARQILSGAEPTRVLSADETTVVVGQRSSGSATAPEARSRASSVVRGLPLGRLAVIGAIALVLLVLVLNDLGGQSPAPDTNTTGEATETSTQAPADTSSVTPVERGEDAAATARNIADWIRDHAGD